MTFSKLVQTLYPLLGDGRKTAEFVAVLVAHFMEEPSNEADIKKAADGDYNPLANLQEATLKHYYNGTRPISKNNASIIRAHTDKAKFENFIFSFSHDTLNSLCVELGKLGIPADTQNIGSVCADLFEQALSQSKGNLKQSVFQTGKEEYAAEIGVFSIRQPPIATAYISNGRLHIGGETIRLSEKLIPPDNIAEEEIGYLPKLYEAYSDAEKPKTVTPETLRDYPQYYRNFREQRINYYNAVYVIEVVRAKFGKEWSEQLDLLKQETYDGISDVYWLDHKHGYDRLNAVLAQASVISVQKSLLSSIRSLIGNSEKKGVCHILVSEGKIKSWVNIYD